MKKAIGVVAVIILLTTLFACGPTPASTPAPATAEPEEKLAPTKPEEPKPFIAPAPKPAIPGPRGYVEVLSHEMKIESGCSIVIGIVKNIKPKAYSLIEVRVKFYDVKGELLYTVREPVWDIEPGEVQEFKIIYRGIAESYKLDIASIWWR